MKKLFTRYVQQPIIKLNVNINLIFSDLVDDVDSLTEDDLKSIAMEQMETAQETNETEKARWRKSRQTVQFYFCFVNFQNCSQDPASRIQFQNYDSDISLNFKFYRSFWPFFSLKTNLIG